MAVGVHLRTRSCLSACLPVLVVCAGTCAEAFCTSDQAHPKALPVRALLASGIDGTELLALTPTALRMSLTLGKVPAAEKVAEMILAERDRVNEARERGAG